MIEGREVISAKGAVAAGPPEAARVGARILAEGGNAMDAASAACLACCMLQPQSTGAAGYVCAGLVLEGKTGNVWSLDSNSRAPAAAREDMFEVALASQGGSSLNEREYFCKVKDDANVYGPLAVGVPGMMAGMGILHERWGRLKWPQIVAPSQKLLTDGFPYASVAGAIKSLEKVIRRFDPTARHLMPDGKLPSPQDIWRRPDMEKTLERISSHGWRDMYTGELGRRIADYIRQIGGILTREDMASFEPRVTRPYTITYRNATVHGPILPNGTLTAMQMLVMLECFDSIRDDTVEYWHRLAEVFKLAWRDRLNHLADPDYVQVPIERLLSKDYAMGRTETVRRFPDHVDKLAPRAPGRPPNETLHVSTADAEGNVVAMTISQGGAFGSCVTVPGTGLILGHGMCRLDPRPGMANSIAPRKRPLNNACPMLLRQPDRDVGIGLPGGRRIVCVAPRMAQCIVEFGATSLEAASAPRMHVEMAEPLQIEETVPQKIITGLRAMGHEVNTVKGIAGGAHNAEFLKKESRARAGGNTWAAGAD